MGLFRRGQSPLFILLVLFLGAIGGALVSEALRDVVPVLSAHRSAGFQLSDLNLAGLLRLNLGMNVQISLGAVAGALVAGLLARRL